MSLIALLGQGNTNTNTHTNTYNISYMAYDMTMCRQEEYIAIVTAMQASENSGNAYEPSRKFQYSLSSSNNIGNEQHQKVVNEECRAKMLNWCLNVSISTMIDDICSCSSLYSNTSPTLSLYR